MSGYEMVITKDTFMHTSRCHLLPADEAPVTAMLAAMREGLEANGYEVNIQMQYTTEVSL